MATAVIVGAAGSGKSTALAERYLGWVRNGARTDQILVLAAGSTEVSHWRERIVLESFGSLEVFSFFGFLQRELMLHWGTVQAAVPELRAWVQPAFLAPEVARERVRALLEPYADRLSDALKAKPRRIAAQVAGALRTAGAAAGLGPAAIAGRLAMADRSQRPDVYEDVREVLEQHRAQCLRAGMLDYALALELFTQVLTPQATYRDHLRRRYSYLLVDDLDETAPAEQDFLEAMAGLVAEAVFAYSTDGGHRTYLGADPEGAWERLVVPNARVDLPGSHTCSPRAFAFGDALARRIRGEAVGERFPDILAGHLTVALRSDLIGAVGEFLAEGVAPGEIAVLAPTVDRALELTLRRALAERGVGLWSISSTRRLLDDPYARALITLAGLVNPDWGILEAGQGALNGMLQVLAGLDPLQAAHYGDLARQAGALPELPTPAGERLRAWVEQARLRPRPWAPDEFVQAAMAWVLGPLALTLGPGVLDACQQLLGRASAFREAGERFGPGAFSSGYVTLLTDATARLPESAPAEPAVVLATPQAYLTRGLSSRLQVWFDISAGGWYPADVKELANPYVLGRRWPEGERWTDRQQSRTRQAGAARLVRALARRCTGQILLAECNLSAWGQEQESELAEALAELTSGPAAEGGGRHG